MAVQSTLSNVPSPKDILLSPYITGPLLLYLTRINPSALERIPWFPETIRLSLPFSLPLNLRNHVALHATPLLKTLKVLLALGVALHLNRIFNRVALNYGHLRKQGLPWNFQTEGEETILVTGGSSGFGKEMVKMFSEQTKAKILVLDVQELPADLRNIPRLTYHKIDLTSPEDIHNVISTVLSQSPPTVLINNAGIAQAHTILNTSDAFLEKLFRVNILSHFTLLRLLLPTMMKQRKGHIVSIASMASYTGQASLADYCASKAAVLGMHESLVQELKHRYADQGGHTIQASIVHPMWASTPLVGSWAPELKRSGQPVLTPKEVASRVVRQVLRGESGSVYVPEKQWQGSFLRGLPDWLALAIRAQLQSATATASAAKEV